MDTGSANLIDRLGRVSLGATIAALCGARCKRFHKADCSMMRINHAPFVAAVLAVFALSACTLSAIDVTPTAAAEDHDALRAVRHEDRLVWRRVRMSLLACSRDISCSALPSTVSSLPNCEESRKNVPTATSEASRNNSISP